ncbi:hypothetical protein BD309DRAFT_972384 [Dichomitus squalens]|nr:hypothetical protein BD309DRAFT_972384 [Dichomitus squalens]
MAGDGVAVVVGRLEWAESRKKRGCQSRESWERRVIGRCCMLSPVGAVALAVSISTSASCERVLLCTVVCGTETVWLLCTAADLANVGAKRCSVIGSEYWGCCGVFGLCGDAEQAEVGLGN